MRSRHAAITIASKNYCAFAATLAQSYLKFHPDHEFIIVLVDKADGMVPARLPCGAEVIEIANFAIPDIGRFIYRYTIMELNTAVKPFVLADLFERRGYESLLYLDPDIRVFRPLAKAQEALAQASIVLTPHMRRPYEDRAHPTDLTILQSGTYNLGFIGLRGGDTTRRLLDWWMGKLYRDCVVDIPNGLFVDQKWIDLVPGFFSDHRILHDPGYNAAYWNLHERPLARVDGAWHAGGEPLAFFHFSGYVPFSPETLSKHQDRHVLRQMPELRALTQAYREELLANGYEESSAWPYAFATLANGVHLPLELVRHVMQWTSHAGVPTPCPVTEPDAFCRFLMSRGVVPQQPDIALLFHFLLRGRGDVVGAYPRALHDAKDESFRTWVRNSGVREYGFGELLRFEEEAITDYVADAFRRLRAADRSDIFARFEAMWRDPEVFAAFAGWLGTNGIRQLRFERRHTEALKRAVPGVGRILNLYFLRGDLQERYAVLGDAGPLGEFVNWLRDNRYEFNLRSDEISLFHEFALASGEQVETMRFLYAHGGRVAKVPAALASIDARKREVGVSLPTSRLAEVLADELPVEPADHHASATLSPEDERNLVAALEARKGFQFAGRVREGLASRPGKTRLNVAGYFAAASGMGESARSLRSTLEHASVSVSEVSLPHPLVGGERIPHSPVMFGWPMAGADASISVANADMVSFLEAFVPEAHWGRRNVGYWVWETEELPGRFRECANRFDEVWAPSRYSAEAIAKAIARPVRVLPHALDFEALDRAEPARRRFRLPAGATLLGFAFDPLSVLERKNVRGLVDAFLAAFRADDDCYLVLKVNGRTQGSFDYESVRARCRSERILFVEGTLSRDDTLSFMRSLDAYVSLHRSEGFGLTCAEAMALGLPVVASDYSGNLEFMDAANSLLVPTRVVETDRTYGAYPAGSRWGEPDLEAAGAMMRSLKDRARREELGRKACASVRARLDPRTLGPRARAMLDALG